MTDPAPALRYPTPQVVRMLNVSAKGGLLLLLAMAVLNPEVGNMEGKGAGIRAIAYPLLAFTIPAAWFTLWRERTSFPWAADLLVTLTCFTDILGNRMDLYDTIVWFDDWMHFANTGLLTAAVVLLTMHWSSSLGATLERSLAFGATAALVWEVAEYYAFLSTSVERNGAYTDTLGDLTLGTLGAVLAGFVVHASWRRGRLRSAAPQLELPTLSRS